MNVDCISCVFSSEQHCLLQTKIQTSNLNTNKQQTMMTCAKPRWGWGSGKWDHFRSEVANGSAAHLQSLATGLFHGKKLVFLVHFLYSRYFTCSDIQKKKPALNETADELC